jgi:hypothetical protein
MPADSNLVLAASSARTTSGQGSALDIQSGTPRRGLDARVIVTAVSGTSPTLDVKIQHSADGSTWRDLAIGLDGSIAQVGEYFIPFETGLRYIRLAWTIGGTSPSFTFSADLVAGRP